MPGRRFYNSTVNVERGSLLNAGALLQQVGTYAAVTGLTGLEAAIQERYSSKRDTPIGIVPQKMYFIQINGDQVPDGSAIKPGDRIKDTGLNKTYTVNEVIKAGDRTWQCMCTFKAA